MHLLFKDPKKMTDEEKEILFLTQLEYIKSGHDIWNPKGDFDMTYDSKAYKLALLTKKSLDRFKKIKKINIPVELICFDGERFQQGTRSADPTRRENIQIINLQVNKKNIHVDKLLGMKDEQPTEKEKLEQPIKEEKPKADKSEKNKENQKTKQTTKNKK